MRKEVASMQNERENNQRGQNQKENKQQNEQRTQPQKENRK